MTTNNGMPSAVHTTATSIESVDAFAKKLYRRARGAGPFLVDITTTVRALHTVLKHLKAEAEDPESLLNSDQSSVYIRQLTPIVEDSDFALKQLDTILEKLGVNDSWSEDDGRNGARDSKRSLDNGQRDMLELIRTKLANQKLNIDIFLDTVQLHNPAKSRQAVDTSNANLDSIKDKVDAIASKITQRKDSTSSEGDDELWLKFRDELEKEGFSKDVLRNNQDVLRAYIRQLDEQRMVSGGPTPTVRGFLEGYQTTHSPVHTAPYPPAYTGPEDDTSPKEMYPAIENEKFFPSMKMERLHPEQYPPYPSSLPTQDAALSFNQRLCEDGEAEDGSGSPTNPMTMVISTRDLMALDKREADLAIAMGNMHLQSNPQLSDCSSSPHSGRYLQPSPSPRLLTSSHFQPVDELGLSPRLIPTIPPPPYGTSPPPTLHANSISAPLISGVQGQQVQRYSRLAPDSQGRDIPLHAQWTRIKRTLVSPEVLNQAGVRYEARPDFVAILGIFNKDEIAEFARRSAEVRRKRAEQLKNPRRDTKSRYHPEKYKNWDVDARRKNGTNGRRRDSSELSSSELCDSSDEVTDEESPRRQRRSLDHEDEEKGTKSYPFIVSPPEKDKDGGSPSATVKPKPILKNKHDDPHVRFISEPQVLDGTSPRSIPRSADRSRDDRRHRDRGDRDHHDREHHHSHHRVNHHDNGSRRKDDHDSRRRRRDYDQGAEDRHTKRKGRGEALKAASIGGAAASLLSVLTEAAAGL
ncbi:hypothetical protein BX600DRAFT_440564 [Xylariales sp. PMI_506]|nr:hypothetical protein BX600DRAFT_440564 [Xylariales sp. PMI_506]